MKDNNTAKYEALLAKLEEGKEISALRIEHEDDAEALRLLSTIEQLQESRDVMTPTRESLQQLLSAIGQDVTTQPAQRSTWVEQYRYVWRIAVPVAALALIVAVVGSVYGPTNGSSIDSIISVAIDDADKDALYAASDAMISGEYTDVLDPLTELETISSTNYKNNQHIL